MSVNQPSVSFDYTSKELLKDPETASLYLEECLADGDLELLKLALKHVSASKTKKTIKLMQ